MVSSSSYPDGHLSNHLYCPLISLPCLQIDEEEEEEEEEEVRQIEMEMDCSKVKAVVEQ